jgi:hypothetical protein
MVNGPTNGVKSTPLTLTLSPRWGERGLEERTFGKCYK